MSELNNVYDFFTRFSFLNDEDIDEIVKVSSVKNFKQGEEFIKLGSTRKKLGIIQKGLIRGYSIKSNGEEVTVIFAKEGEIASTYDLIFHDRPTRQIVEFLEPTDMMVFEYREIERLAEGNPRIERLKHQFIEDFLIKVLERLETFLICTPEERYLWLIEEDETLLQRVQQRHLASFLGITPVSLSRLKSRISKR